MNDIPPQDTTFPHTGRLLTHRQKFENALRDSDLFAKMSKDIWNQTESGELYKKLTIHFAQMKLESSIREYVSGMDVVAQNAYMDRFGVIHDAIPKCSPAPKIHDTGLVIDFSRHLSTYLSQELPDCLALLQEHEIPTLITIYPGIGFTYGLDYDPIRFPEKICRTVCKILNLVP